MSAPRDLLKFPLWRPEDLGAPMPDLPHANSVCLPTWRDVVEYEEKNPRVINRLQAGYPRFVVPPACRELFEIARRELARAEEGCHLYRSAHAAARCAEWIQRWCGVEASTRPWRGVHAVLFPASAETYALKYWRHTGDGISSRMAEAMLNGNGEPDGAEAAEILRRRIAHAVGVSPNDVYLFSCGMSAIYTLYRAVRRLASDRGVAQFGFPYVDTLKIIKDFGAPHSFYPRANDEDVRKLSEACEHNPPGALFCEFPSNPMLISADLRELRRLADRWRFPIIIDDTIATWTNVDLRGAADAIVTSLTKWFTGRGDVMLGSVVINPNQPLASVLHKALESEMDDRPWGGSLCLAEELSRDADERVRRASQTAHRIAVWLSQHPAVANVFYPAFQQAERYERFKRPDGGYGGLLSFVLRDPERSSPVFYDALALCKGPNLGTTFTLCCPFTLLAHYDELDWAESCGVSRWLIRLSIGQEEPEELIARLDRALSRVL